MIKSINAFLNRHTMVLMVFAFLISSSAWSCPGSGARSLAFETDYSSCTDEQLDSWSKYLQRRTSEYASEVPLYFSGNTFELAMSYPSSLGAASALKSALNLVQLEILNRRMDKIEKSSARRKVDRNAKTSPQ